MKLRPPPEAVEQRMLAQWCDLRGLLWAHVPNGGARNIVTGRQLKEQGVKPGVPDCLIFTPPRHGEIVRGVAIELKTRTGQVSDAQQYWLDALSQQCGWATHVARGAHDAITYLQRFGF